MKKRDLELRLLTPEKINMIHDKTLELLENYGMKVEGEEIIEYLKAYGCIQKDAMVLFPKHVVEKALASAPKEIILYNRDGQENIVLDAKNNVYFGTHADQAEILDYKNNRTRPFLKTDIKTMCQLANQLDNLHFIFTVGLCTDVAPQIASQVAFLETVKHFSKTINFSANSVESMQEIIDMAAIVAGGYEKLAQKPFIFNFCEPVSPLAHSKESTGSLMICAKNKIPVAYVPYTMMGATSAVTIAGALVQNNAEILAGLVMTQAVNEGAPFIYGAMPTIFDMVSTIGSYGAPEFHKAIAAASEIADYYQLPFYGTAGCSDAKTLDLQAVAESQMELFAAISSKANLVHDLGIMDHCNSVSPAMLVLANEMIDQLGAFGSEIEVNDETMAVEVIEKVGASGHFLHEMHTLMHFKELWYPKIFKREQEASDESEIFARLKLMIEMLLNMENEMLLDAETLKQLQKYEMKYLAVKDTIR
ncbi:trimethylamine methyltransferase family protein [Eubacteriaceae bacterium ES3]|nr:trimethylamine methyltransferase family protein [Eubacteriaceae bacterium ES3]